MKKTAPLLFSGAIIFLIIGISLFIYFFTRKSKTDETEETEETGDLPTVKDAGIELVLNPADTADKVEEYSIFTTEYAIGQTTAKNIDIKLTWTNGPTFASVSSLIFVHKANNKKVRDNIETIDNIDSNATNELILKGEQLTSEDIVGDNTIDMYWNKIDDTNNKLITISFKITQEHLDTTLNLNNAIPIGIQVSLSSSSSQPSGDVIATYTKYRILPFFTDPVHIRKTSDNDGGFHVIKGDQKQSIDGVDTFYIVKALGKDFISKDVSGDNILNGYTKEFVSKNDIFGDVDIMNSSAITLEDGDVKCDGSDGISIRRNTWSGCPNDCGFCRIYDTDYTAVSCNYTTYYDDSIVTKFYLTKKDDNEYILKTYDGDDVIYLYLTTKTNIIGDILYDFEKSINTEVTLTMEDFEKLLNSRLLYEFYCHGTNKKIDIKQYMLDL